MCSDDHRFFGGKGYAPAFADWAASRAIAVDSSLHVLHLWPRAVGAGGKQRLTDARRLAALECASDGGVLYEKKVRLGRGALHRYLRSAYGDVSWIRPSNYEAHDGLAPLVVFVLHSSAVRMSACKQRVRDLFNLSTDTVQRKAACHATDTHTEVGAAPFHNRSHHSHLRTRLWPSPCGSVGHSFAIAILQYTLLRSMNLRAWTSPCTRA